MKIIKYLFSLVMVGVLILFLFPLLNKKPIINLGNEKKEEPLEVVYYKTETHLHSKESNYDGYVSVIDIIQLYKEEGYSTIIETPHISEKHYNKVNKDWDGFIDVIISGYKKAQTIDNFNYLFAIELTLVKNNNDYLIYGITESFLREHEFIYNLSLSELATLCSSNNFLLIQPHPFRNGYKIDPIEYRMPIERYNGQFSAKNNNELAEAYWKENNIIGVSGSDFHKLEDLARGGVITTKEIKNIEDYIELILKNDFEIISK